MICLTGMPKPFQLKKGMFLSLSRCNIGNIVGVMYMSLTLFRRDHVIHLILVLNVGRLCLCCLACDKVAKARLGYYFSGGGGGVNFFKSFISLKV